MQVARSLRYGQHQFPSAIIPAPDGSHVITDAGHRVTVDRRDRRAVRAAAIIEQACFSDDQQDSVQRFRWQAIEPENAPAGTQILPLLATSPLHLSRNAGFRQTPELEAATAPRPLDLLEACVLFTIAEAEQTRRRVGRLQIADASAQQLHAIDSLIRLGLLETPRTGAELILSGWLHSMLVTRRILS